MKTIIKILFLCVIIVLTACSSEEDKKEKIVVCGVENPLENLEWIKALVSSVTANPEIDSASLTSYDYLDSQAIYLHKHIIGHYDNPNIIYNCEGQIIFKLGGSQPNDSSAYFFNNAINPRIIWSK